MFLHDKDVARVREAQAWLPSLLYTGRVAISAALRYAAANTPEASTAGAAATRAEPAEPAPDMRDVDNFPQLVDNGLPLVFLEDEAEPLWNGARQIAFKQILNAFCNTLPQQSRAVLEDVYAENDYALRPTMAALLAMGARCARTGSGIVFPSTSLCPSVCATLVCDPPPLQAIRPIFN